MPPTRIFIIVLSFLAGGFSGLWAESTSPEAVHVGMDGHLSISLPAPQVFTKRQSRSSDILVQITPEMIPTNSRKGEPIPYKIIYTAFTPGSYNLADSLVRIDSQGNAVPIEQAIPVNVTSSLPVNYDGKLIPAESRPYELFTLYNILAIVVCLIWGLLIIPWFYWGRKSNKHIKEKEEAPLPSIEEILKPLLKEAKNNELDDEGKTKLEKALFLQLRTHLNMEKASPLQVILALKQNEQTAASIEILESWLHRRQTKEAPNTLSSKDYQQLVAASHPHNNETNSIEGP